MMSIQEKIKQVDTVINEIESMFKIQTMYFKSRDVGDLQRLKAQQHKVKQLISIYKQK